MTRHTKHTVRYTAQEPTPPPALGVAMFVAFGVLCLIALFVLALITDVV